MATDGSQLSNSGRLRFGISSLLLVILFLAIGLGGYKLGFERGRRRGNVIPALSSGSIYVQEYDVADLASQGVDIDKLVREIRSSVVVDSWDVVGGYATIRFDAKSVSLLVEQESDGHASVTEYLCRFRD